MGEQISDRYNQSQQLKVNSDGSIEVDNHSYATRLSHTAEGRTEYIGHAQPGSNAQSASWRIKKQVYIDGKMSIILYADGNATFDNVWSDRTSLKYGYQGTKTFTADVVLV